MRDRLLGRPTDDVDVALDGRPARRRAGDRPRHRRRGLRALRRVRRLARGRPRPRAGTSTSSRCATATSRPTSRRATSRSTRWPSRWPAATCSTPTAAAPTSRPGSCGWCPSRRSRTTRCARCARPARHRARPRARPRHGAPPRAARARDRPRRPRARVRRAQAGRHRRRARARACELMDAHGLTDAVLPELAALRGVEQNEFHHADVLGHTLEVLDAVAALERARRLGDNVADLLAEPLADELTRGGAMRFAALLHDAAKPQTRGVRPDGRVTFIGHDEVGAELARDVLAPAAGVPAHDRLRRRAHPAPPAARLPRPRAAARPPLDLALPARHRALQRRRHDLHGRRPAGHARPQSRGGDRRPRRARARRCWPPTAGRAEPLIRGDDLARELGIVPGPQLGELLAQLEEDRYAGEIATREEAIDSRALGGLASGRCQLTRTACSARSSPARSRPRAWTRTSAPSPSWTSTPPRAATCS